MRLILALIAAALPAASQQAISLLALDRQGQPLLDLQASDLRLFDNGRPQPIASLTRVQTPSPIVILYDLLNTVIGERGDSVPQMAVTLQTLPALTPIYMYVLSGDASLVPVHGLDAGESPAWPREAGPLIDSALRNLRAARGNEYAATGARVSATYRALSQLGKLIARRPGRKSIVWITRGTPLHMVSVNDVAVDFLPVLKEAAGTLVPEQVAVYAVKQTTSPEAGTLDSRPMTLEHFASITGGHAYLTETLGHAIADAVRDAASSYRLTFHGASKPDGIFHKLRLTCNRPGIRLQSPQGYLIEP
jgi:VWFA-related protein